MEILITESQLRLLLNEEYSEKVIQQLVDKFKLEDPNEEASIIRGYIQRFDKLKGNSKITNKDIFSYSLDGLRDVLFSTFKNTKPKSYKGNSDLDLVYDNNDNLKIYVADTREKCITYGKGYSFCISSYSDFSSYKNYRMDEKGTPYFVFNSNFRKNYSEDEESFWDPEHLLVVFIHLDDFEGIRYTVTDANNEGEIEYDYFEKIERDYPFLRGLKNIFKPIDLSDKESELLRMYEYSKVEFKKIEKKYDKLIKPPKEGSIKGFRDSCDNYLPYFHSIDDFTSVTNKPLFDSFRKGQYKSYTASFNGMVSKAKLMGVHYGETGYQKAKEQIDKTINGYKIEENTMRGHSFWNEKKERYYNYMTDENNYEIIECKWDSLYINYLREVYTLGVKLMYKKSLIDSR